MKHFRFFHLINDKTAKNNRKKIVWKFKETSIIVSEATPNHWIKLINQRNLA